MAIPDELLGTADAFAVVDAFSLYRISVSHSPAATAVQESALRGDLRLIAPAVTFAVSCGMRTCWDDECDQEHTSGTGTAVQKFHELGGFEVVDLTPGDAVSAGQLYARCVDSRIEGAEVLAACYSFRLAGARNALLISSARASYCYTVPRAAEAVGYVHLL